MLDMEIIRVCKTQKRGHSITRLSGLLFYNPFSEFWTETEISLKIIQPNQRTILNYLAVVTASLNNMIIQI